MSVQRATIKPENGPELEVMFNPDTVTLTRTPHWSTAHTNGQQMGSVTYAADRPSTLGMTLIFDGSEEGQNVAKIVNQLTKMTKVDEKLGNDDKNVGGSGGTSTQHRPPTVDFAWGSFLIFKGVISKLTAAFNQFLDDGTPVRASVVIEFTQVKEDNVFPKQNPTSGGRTGERIHRLAPRETLDQVAYANFGQTGLWRALAAFNGIDDPLRLQAGDPILLPPSIDDLKALA
jgi:hypothetical protein